MHSYKLGKLPAVFPRGMPIMSGHTMMARKAPSKIIRAVDPGLQMDRNDTLGDCSASALANCARGFSRIYGGALDVPEQSVVDFYGLSTGYSPDKPGSDQGGVELDVLACAARNGIVYGDGNRVPLVPLWGSIEPEDRNGIWLCLEHAPVYLGLQLAMADQAAVGEVWDTATAGDQTPGSWGGHASMLWSAGGDQPDDLVEIGTWGNLQKATVRWLMSRMDEAHAVFWRQLMRTNVLGINFDNMAADCSSYLGYR